MKKRFLFLLVLLPVLTFAQSEHDDQLFEIRSDSAAISSQQVLSMILVREFNIESGHNPVTKLMTSEFNAFGQPVYTEKSPYFYVDYDFYQLSYRIQERFEYDPQHRLSNYCYNYKKRIQCQLTEYDKLGYITRIASYDDSPDTIEMLLQWQAGKMIRATFKDPIGYTSSLKRTVNEAGKITEYIAENYRTTYNYSQIGNEETTTVHTYFHDTLKNVYIQSVRSDKNLLTYLAELNHKLDTLTTITATYDAQGNITAYENKSYSYEMDESGDVPPQSEPTRDARPPVERTSENQNKLKIEPEITIEKLVIVNEYSDQKLLIKRLIYRISPSGERMLMAIDRVIYEKEPLLAKPWYVEDENEYGDYGDE